MIPLASRPGSRLEPLLRLSTIPEMHQRGTADMKQGFRSENTTTAPQGAMWDITIMRRNTCLNKRRSHHESRTRTIVNYSTMGMIWYSRNSIRWEKSIVTGCIIGLRNVVCNSTIPCKTRPSRIRGWSIPSRWGQQGWWSKVVDLNYRTCMLSKL